MKFPNNNCGECGYWLAFDEPETTIVQNEEILKHCQKCRIDRFLDELSDLTEKYEIEISGCGCCGSPFLVDMEQGGFVGDNLTYDEEKGKYDTD